MMQLSEREPQGLRPIWTAGSQRSLVETSAWTGKRLMACRAEPDLVAVYESQNGSLALLLRHAIVPLAQERRLWCEATRRAVGGIIGRLRRANLERRFVVLQWLRLDEVARILRHWTCRYAGDTERQAEIARVIEVHLADRAFLASLRAIREGPHEVSRTARDV